jgi:hypothetical protein
MRWMMLLVAILALVTGSFTWDGAAIGRSAAAQPGSTETPVGPPETPIVDPDPPPGRIFLAWVARGEDATEPPPLVADGQGFVATLNARGRVACAPATHVLLAEREGTLHNHVLAALAADSPDVTLDFFIGEYVAIAGTESTAPATCQDLTARLLGVRRIERVPHPPGD